MSSDRDFKKSVLVPSSAAAAALLLNNIVILKQANEIHDEF